MPTIKTSSGTTRPRANRTKLNAEREYPGISVDPRGVAYIEGTQTKVLTVVQNKRASRNTPEQLQTSMPHLTLAQVYAALAYYYSHKSTVDRQIRESVKLADEFFAGQPPSPTRAELVAHRNRPSSKPSQ